MNGERFTHTKVRLLTWYNPDPPMIPIRTICFKNVQIIVITLCFFYSPLSLDIVVVLKELVGQHWVDIKSINRGKNG